MPSERAEEPWVDAMDGPERLERAKKRRAEQMKRWERRESTTTDDVKRKRKGSRVLKFEPNLVILEAAARNDLDEGLYLEIFLWSQCDSTKWWLSGKRFRSCI